MRPIKFRAWLNYDKQITEWGDLHKETDEDGLFIWVGDHDNDHLKNGKSINWIAKHFGVDWSTIKSRVDENPELLEADEQ